jgi:hypothetical protein
MDCAFLCRQQNLAMQSLLPDGSGTDSQVNMSGMSYCPFPAIPLPVRDTGMYHLNSVRNTNFCISDTVGLK